jgi:hypothetical protein
MDIPRDSYGLFVCDKTGRPKIFTTNSITQLVDDQDNYDFKDKTRLNFVYLLGVSITRPQTTPQKITPSLTCATEAVLSTLKLNLRDQEDIAVENLPLTKIAEANANGFIWQGYQGVANIAESELKCVDAANQSNNTAAELHWHYLKLKASKSYKDSAI